VQNNADLRLQQIHLHRCRARNVCGLLRQRFDQSISKRTARRTVNITFAEASLKQCAQKLGVDYNKLDKCSTSSEGEGYFQKEKALTPTHTGVPFVTINGGAVIYNSQTLNLVQEVCNAYKGSKKPAACTSLNSTITNQDSYTSLLTPA